jgi:hypothetical protein
VIHDQEIARLPHRMPQNDQENQANFIEIERLLNQRPSYVPWTLNYPSSFDFNDPCVTQTRITDLAGSAGKLKIVKEHDWTALTIDFHSSFQTTAQDSVFNFFAKVESGFIAPDPILIGVSYLKLVNSPLAGIHMGHSMTTGEITEVPYNISDAGPLRAGNYEITIYAERIAGAGNLRYNLYDYFWIRALEHPPAPRLV